MALAALWRLWRGEVARIELRHGHQIVRGNTYLFQADRTIYRYVAGAHARGVAVS